jgi:type I restriction enzyme S subunit
MLPEGWSNRTVGDCIKFEGGSQPPKSVFSSQPGNGYVRFVQTRDFKSDRFATFIPIELARNSFCESDIMIGRYGPPVFQIYRGLSGSYNVALIKAIPKPIIDQDYAYYFLRGEKLHRHIDSLSRRSAGQAGVEMEFLKNYPLPLPPLGEQRKIAEILSTWDAAIETAEKLLVNAEAQEEALVQQLLTGSRRLKGFAGAWTQKPLAAIVTRIQRKTDGRNHPILTISSTLGFIRQDQKYSRYMAGKSVEKYVLLREGEFAYNKGNSKSFEYGCVFDLKGFETGLVPHVYVCFRLKEGLSHRFFRALFAADYLRAQLGRLVNTGVRNNGLLNISPNQFLGTKVPVPTLAEQEALGEVLEDASASVVRHRHGLDNLLKQRSALMQQLLTGRRRVKR